MRRGFGAPLRGTGSRASTEPQSVSALTGFDPARVILRIAEVAQNIGYQAGVGGMETAGSIVSYLAKHPEQIADFMAENGSVMDWPPGWHTQGCLTWHGMNGKIVSPEFARRAKTIRKLEQGK